MGLFQTLHLVLLLMVDQALNAPILIAIEAEVVEFLQMIQAELIILPVPIPIFLLYHLLEFMLHRENGQVLGEIILCRSQVHLLAFRAEDEIGGDELLDTLLADRVPAVGQQAGQVLVDVELVGTFEAIHSVRFE